MTVPPDERLGVRFTALGSLKLRAPSIALRWLSESTLLAIDTMARISLLHVA